MPLNGQYLEMNLYVDDSDPDHLEYFQFHGQKDFRLQKCTNDGLLRYPPGPSCPWCGNGDSTWEPVEGKGTVHSYAEVGHAINPKFAPYLPYHLLLVELDTQRDTPTPGECLRITGNLVGPDGNPAPADVVRKVGIGTRVRMVQVPVGDNFALPQWEVDDTDTQPEPWRYPYE